MWIALFSQTGKEIADISEAMDWNYPDRILTDRNNSHVWDERIDHRVEMMKHEDICEILNRTEAQDIVTLHGYLRILSPGALRGWGKFFNGHPGDIISYPQLKGKDPQKKAFEQKLPHTGVVIHKVTNELDGGPIYSYNRLDLAGKYYELPELIKDLRELSVHTWINFLERYKD